MSVKRHTALVAIIRAVRASGRPGSPGVQVRLAAVPRMASAVLRGSYRGLGRGRLAMFGLAVLYIVSPIDLAPEALLAVFGLADDALVAVWLTGGLLDEAERFLAWERTRPDLIPGHVVDDHGRG